MSENVVYMNLNSYPIVITTERGLSLTVNSFKAVKGEYFATWAAPRGPLSMVHENNVTPEAVMYEAKPFTVNDEQVWADRKKKLDPAIFEVPAQAGTNVDTVSESDSEEAAAVVTTEADQTEVEQQPKRKKKK